MNTKRLSIILLFLASLLFIAPTSADAGCRGDCSNGWGTYTWANGDKYVGDFRDNKRNGQGTYTLANGNKYVGEWRNDNQHGQGTKTYVDGSQWTGEWRNDEKYKEDESVRLAQERRLEEERRRIAEEKRLADDRRKLEEERKRLEEERKRIAEEQRRDTTPPQIRITSHQADRGVFVAARLSRTTVTGLAMDDSGVAEVAVNGQTASLDARGNFSLEIFLKVGRNDIIVTAMDTRRNVARKSFTIDREALEVSRVPEPEQPMQIAAGTGQYYALIIGNNQYKYLPELETAINDAREVERVLRNQYGFETKLLLDATRRDILDGLEGFRKRLRSTDHFLVYYAGHGEFEQGAKKAYWLPVDAKPDSVTDWIIATASPAKSSEFPPDMF